MSDKPENPAAFPAPEFLKAGDAVLMANQRGMTLRDYFAAAALQGIMVNGSSNERSANLAYEHADFMLKAGQS